MSDKDDDAPDSPRAEIPRQRDVLTLAQRAFDARLSSRTPGPLDDRWEAAYNVVRARMAFRSHGDPAVQKGKAAKV